jgi:integrase
MGKIGDPKSRASKAPVPMCAVLAEFMTAWHRETPYAQPQDFVFFSEKLRGKKPRTGNMVSQDYLRPAALKAGVLTVAENGTYFDRKGREVRRFGFHNLRHSLSTWLIEQGEDPKVVQGILRHAAVGLTLDRYTQVVPRKTVAAQAKYMDALLAEEKQVPDLKSLKPASDAVN